jgi:acetyl-CoA carboxylase alpha subunit
VYIWQQDVTVTKKQILQLEKNKKRMYTLVIGQCLLDLETKLHGSAAYAKDQRLSGCCTATSHHMRILLML